MLPSCEDVGVLRWEPTWTSAAECAAGIQRKMEPTPIDPPPGAGTE